MKSRVRNAFVTIVSVNPSFSGFSNSQNVNKEIRITAQNVSGRFSTTQNNSEPFRTFVLGGFLYAFMLNCDKISINVKKRTNDNSK